MLPRIARAAAAALAALSGAAAAAEPPPLWRICPQESHLGFEVTVNGRVVEGDLPAFRGEGRFDPDRAAETTLTLVIDMTQLDVGPAVADHFARSVDWFDTRAHPAARFRLTEMRPADGEGVWRASGTLALRDAKREVSAELRLDLGEETARAWGETVVDRRDFGLGKGVSAALVTVGEEVRVIFDLRARSAKARANATGSGAADAASCPTAHDLEQ